MSIPNSSDRAQTGEQRPDSVLPGAAPDVQPAERAWACGECGLLYTSAGMLDYCDSCGASRCRACAARDNDDVGGVYICSTCANDLDPL